VRASALEAEESRGIARTAEAVTPAHTKKKPGLLAENRVFEML